MLKKRSNLVPNIYGDRKPHNFIFLILKLIEEIFVSVEARIISIYILKKLNI